MACRQAGLLTVLFQQGFHIGGVGFPGRPSQTHEGVLAVGAGQLSGQLSGAQRANPINLVGILPAQRPSTYRNLRSIVVHHQLFTRETVVALGASLFEVPGTVQEQAIGFEGGSQPFELS